MSIYTVEKSNLPIIGVLDKLSKSKPDDITENGDPCYSTLGIYYEKEKQIISQIFELKQSLVGNDKDFIESNLNSRWCNISDAIKLLDSTSKNRLIVFLFKFCFFTRAIRCQGNRSRKQFYCLLKKTREDFPSETLQLMKLIPEYGYFKDLDNLIDLFDEDEGMIQELISIYGNNLKSDLNRLLIKNIDDIELKELQSLVDVKNSELKKKTTQEIFDFNKELPDNKFSFAAKWIPRENKKNGRHRHKIIFYMFPTIKPNDTKGLYLGQMILRKGCSAISQCLNVIEQYMTGGLYRNWADIEVLTSSNPTKYKKALLNINKLGEERYDTKDRRKCRENILEKILNDKLNGAQQDIKKIADIIWSESISMTREEKDIINCQWKKMVENVSNLIEETIEKDRQIKENSSGEDTKSITDPRNCIPVVDVSGSMSSFNVMQYSIILGILCSSISKIPGKLITFSDSPEVFSFDPKKDIFELFEEIRSCKWGGSTNLDKTFNLLVGEMSKARSKGVDVSSNFSLLILTDGQFDSMISYMGTPESFQERQENLFANFGFDIPLIIYWNLARRSVGFPAQSDTKGVKLVSGFSQTIMVEVMTGDYLTVIDEETGLKKLNLDPLESFIKTLGDDSLKPIEDTLLEYWDMSGNVKEAWS